MSSGLLAGLDDPVFMARIFEQRQLILNIAARFNCSYEAARDWLERDDSLAMDMFAIGNSIPREILH